MKYDCTPLDPAAFGEKRRMEAIAEQMQALNVYLSRRQASLEPVLLPFRDGLTIVRFKGRHSDPHKDSAYNSSQ